LKVHSWALMMSATGTPDMLRNSRLRLGGGYLLIAVIGAAGAMIVTSVFGISIGTVASDRLAVVQSADTSEPEGFPVTTHGAISAGWQEISWCIGGHGRYFTTQQAGDISPLMLVYSHYDRLIALNLYSPTEQPSPPWQHFPDGITTGLQGRDSEHWGLSIYLSDPHKACESHIHATSWRGG